MGQSDEGYGECGKSVQTPTEPALPVEVIDWLEFALKQRKIDCEYDILLDPRFAALQIPSIVLEWHATRERPQADSEIISKLTGGGRRDTTRSNKVEPRDSDFSGALRPTS